MSAEVGGKSPVWMQSLIDDTAAYATKVILGEGQDEYDTFDKATLGPGWKHLGSVKDAPWVTYSDAPAPSWSPSWKNGDIVAEIDKLASEERCPHCDRDWHTQRLTQRMWAMYQDGRFDANYFTGEDTSTVLCEGSESIGPLRPLDWRPPYASGGSVSSAWTLASLTALKHQAWTTSTYTITIKPNLGGFSTKWELFDESWNSLFKSPEPECPELDADLPDVKVEFGPEHWPLEHVTPPPAVEASVAQRWHQFNRIDIPTPTPRKADWTSLVNQEFPQYPTSKKGKK